MAVVFELDKQVYTYEFTLKEQRILEERLLIMTKTENVKYQIFLVEKDQDGSSNAWRLDEVKGVRSDDNYYMKYIAGAFGATPKIS